MISRDGRRLEAEVHVEKHWVEIRGAREPVRCAVSAAARQIWVTRRGVTWVLERVQRESSRDEGATGEDEIRAPMTGRVVRVAAAPAGAELVVADDGPGIPDDVLPRIFEPFFTTKTAGSGTGLGLAVTREIVSRHGGRIDVETDARGTRFRVTLPAAGDVLQDVKNFDALHPTT